MSRYKIFMVSVAAVMSAMALPSVVAANTNGSDVSGFRITQTLYLGTAGAQVKQLQELYHPQLTPSQSD